MNRSKMIIKVSSQSKLFNQKRRIHSVDGKLNASTKVENVKGKKIYKRYEFKNSNNW